MIAAENVVPLGEKRYRLTLVNEVHPLPWLWYVKVADSDGEAMEQPTWQTAPLRHCVAVVLSQEDASLPRMPAQLLADWLKTTLNRNRKGLDAALQSTGYNHAEIKSIQVSVLDIPGPTPTLEITPASYEVTEEGALRYDFGEYRFSVVIGIRVHEPRPETYPALAVAEMAFFILRRDAYRSVVLDCGLTIVDGSPQGWRWQEWVEPDGSRGIRVILEWRGQMGISLW